MPFLKNLRGAKTYAAPATPEYEDNYDRIFGKKELPGEHEPCAHRWKTSFTPTDYGTGSEAVQHCTECGAEYDGD